MDVTLQLHPSSESAPVLKPKLSFSMPICRIIRTYRFERGWFFPLSAGVRCFESGGYSATISGTFVAYLRGGTSFCMASLVRPLAVTRTCGAKIPCWFV